MSTAAAVDGLDPDVARLIARVEAEGRVSADTGTPPQQVREQFDALLTLVRPAPSPPFAGTVGNDVVCGVPVRRYEPDVVLRDGVVVFIHGGGWVVGGLDSADPHARAISSHLGVTTVSVDYRLAPEHPYPAPFDDCLAVLRGLDAGTSTGWRAVAGDSAGGNLAASVALAATRARLRLDAQLLFFPATDCAMTTASHRDNGEGYLLDRRTIDWYWNAYRAGAPVDDYLAPLSATDEALSRVAPAVITTAEFDPLRDEGAHYAQRLIGAGVDVTYLANPGLIHGWLDHVQLVPAALTARTRALDALANFLV